MAVDAISMEDMRWERCDIKSTSLLANVLAREQAARAGAREAIFLRNGCVTEGAASNVFIARGQTIKTPPLSPHILPGVTRNLIVELFAARAPAVVEAPVTAQELFSADEVWLSSSSRELVPVVRIDGRKVGDGVVGPNFQLVRTVYRQYKSSY
jgi:D-alanine transaminase